MANRYRLPSLLGVACILPVFLAAAPASTREVLEKPAGQQGAYSPAVITEGGKVVWLAGQTTLTDLDGKSIAYDFDAQLATVFKLIERNLERAGGKMSDIVITTTFITEGRLGPRFSELRRKIFEEKFPKKDYPASSLITVSGLASPGMMIEVQAIAVIGGK